MRTSKEHKQWLKERDETAYTFNVDKFKAFYLEEGDEGYEENYSEHDSDPFWDLGHDSYHKFTPYGY